MKLILCPECSCILSLIRNKRKSCDCGESWGEYKDDGLYAEIGGRAIPLGFANNSFLNAICNRPKSGQGKVFDAFVIPEECPTITEIK